MTDIELLNKKIDECLEEVSKTDFDLDLKLDLIKTLEDSRKHIFEVVKIEEAFKEITNILSKL